MISQKLFSIFLLFLIVTSSVSSFISYSDAQLFNFGNPSPQSDSSLIERTADANIYYNPTTHQNSWQSAPLWISDNQTDSKGYPVYKPYRVFDYPAYTQVESAQGSFIFNKITCSGQIYKAGWINSSAIISSDSYIFRIAKNGTNNWFVPSAISNTSCQAYVTQNGNDIEVGGIKHVGNLGELKIRYIKNEGSGIESTIDITNWNASATNYKFATTQTINLPSQFITIGNTTVNLANYNGTFLNHNWIVNHKGQLLKLAGKVDFDLTGSFKHVWGITINWNGSIASLSIDYAMNAPILSSGETLEIDPTFTATSPTIYGVQYGNHADDTPCGTTSASATSSADESYGAPSGVAYGCDTVIQKFSLSTLPSSALINSVQLREGITASSLAGNFNGSCTIRQVLNDPASMSANQLLNNATAAPIYLTTLCSPSQTFTYNLGATGSADLKNQLKSNFFAVGIQKQTWVQSNAGAFTTGVTMSSPTLIVNYTVPVPNQVTISSCSSNSPMTNTCTWNTPTIPKNGSDTLGYYVNRNGTNPPLYSSNLVGYWKMDGINSVNQIPDYGSLKNNATLLTGTISQVRGQIGYAMNFNSTNSLTAGTTSSFNFLHNQTAKWTWTDWIKFPNYVHTGVYNIFQTDNGGGTNLVGVTIFDDNRSGKIHSLAVQVTNGGGVNAVIACTQNNAFANDTNWHFLSITDNYLASSNNMQLYVDGTLLKTCSNTGQTASNSNANLALQIGGNSGGFTSQFPGYQDDFRLYNFILTQAQLTNLYNYRLVNNPLISQYSFENSLRDSIGGDNGTGTGSISYTTGKFGQALSLGGSSYDTLANNQDFNFGTQNKFTLAIWERTASTSQQVMVSHDAWTNQGYMLYMNNGIVTFRIQDSGGTNYEVSSSATYNDNAWHLIVAQYNGNQNKNGETLYVDGSLVATGSSASISNSITNNINAEIGGSNGANGLWVGQLDEARIFQNYNLSTEEITNLLNSNTYTYTPTLTDSYLLTDGNAYSYQVYPVNLFGQNNTSTAETSIVKNYAPPPNTIGKFYKDASNAYHVQFNWSQPPKINSDPYQATGYQILNCNSLPCTVLANNQTSPLSFTFSNLAQQTFQKLQVKSWSHFGLSPGYSFVKSNASTLVSHWPMDNSTIDIGPQLTPLTVQGNENYTVGHNGYALNLDGITWASPASGATSLYSYNIINPFTVSAWIKTSQTGHFQALLTKDYNGTHNGWYTDQNGTHADFVIRSGGTSYDITGSKTINNGKWQFLTFVYTGNSNKNGMMIYVNGTVDITGANTSISGSAINADLFALGTYANGITLGQGTPWIGQIDDPRIYSSALNSTQVGELWNEQITTKANNNINQITGTHVLSHDTVGNMDRETSILTITGGFPSPTITNFHLYNNTNVVNNTNVNTIINSGQTQNFLYGNFFNVTHGTNFKGVARISNGTATELINSTSYPVGPIYSPTYKTASNGWKYNYTLLRTNSGTNVTLRSNVAPVLFNMSCQFMVPGGSTIWHNQTSIGFFQQSQSVHSYDNVYGTCYDPDPTLLFSFVSYGNSSIFPAINLMNTSYQGYIGVPVGVLFLVIMGALANKRTAPTWGIILIAVAGILATVGFFTLSTGYWALIIIAGLLISFVGRKVL